MTEKQENEKIINQFFKTMTLEELKHLIDCEKELVEINKINGVDNAIIETAIKSIHETIKKEFDELKKYFAPYPLIRPMLEEFINDYRERRMLACFKNNYEE